MRYGWWPASLSLLGLLPPPFPAIAPPSNVLISRRRIFSVSQFFLPSLLSSFFPFFSRPRVFFHDPFFRQQQQQQQQQRAAAALRPTQQNSSPLSPRFFRPLLWSNNRPLPTSPPPVRYTHTHTSLSPQPLLLPTTGHNAALSDDSRGLTYYSGKKKAI